MRGQQVALLVEAAAPGDDRLAGRLHAVDRRADFVQHRHPAAVELVEHQVDAADVLVLGGRVEHDQQVAQFDGAAHVAADVGQQRIAQAAGMRFHQVAAQFQHQRGLRAQRLGAAAEDRDQQGDHDDQEQDVQHEAPGGVQAAPEHADTTAQGSQGLEGHRNSTQEEKGIGIRL